MVATDLQHLGWPGAVVIVAGIIAIAWVIVSGIR